MTSGHLGKSGLPSRLAGVVTSEELRRAGVAQARLRLLLRRGVLVPLGRGVYANAAQVQRVGQIDGGMSALRVSAALAVVGQDAVGSHRHAAGAASSCACPQASGPGM